MIRHIQVVGAVFKSGNTFLAAQRGEYKTAGGKWEFPGGKVNPNEDPQAALQREILEELGISVEVKDLLDRSITRVGDLDIDLACYFVESTAQPVQSTDHDELRWVTPEELRSLEWSTPDLPAVSTLLALNSLPSRPKDQGVANSIAFGVD